ncbi:MAG: endonuclease III [Alphaproteobacteria bacterium]|nr:endonuclease III [Alphaproteobacteria bacterium]
MTNHNKTPLSQAQILEIFQRFEQHNPNPQGELDYTNNFTLLIAVLLSAQATDKSVNQATKALFAKADNAQAMAQLQLSELENYIKTIGLWRSKASNIAALCQQLLQKHNGIVPSSYEELVQLPGVGRKTANVVLNTAFNQPTIAVDTHIFRLSNRLKLAPAPTPIGVEQKLAQIIPKQYIKNSHLWLILHGRYICKARKALCEQCFLADLCPADCNQSSIFKA